MSSLLVSHAVQVEQGMLLYQLLCMIPREIQILLMIMCIQICLNKIYFKNINYLITFITSFVYFPIIIQQVNSLSEINPTSTSSQRRESENLGETNTNPYQVNVVRGGKQ